jgi:trimeric autotransporter adhesin
MTTSAIDQTILSASSFVGSIGVNTHAGYAWDSYNNLALMVDDLKYLGVTTLRDSLAANPAAQPVLDGLANAGFKFDFIVPSNIPAAGSAGLQQYLASVDSFEATHPGGIVALEGLNEANVQPFSYNGSSSIAAAGQFQQAYYTAIKGDAGLANIPVYDLTIGYNDLSGYSQLGNLSASTDFINSHAYASTETTPQAALAASLSAASSVASGKPVVITETGYTTQSNTPFLGADQSVQAKSILNTLVDAYKDGVSTTYLYELLDHPSTGAANDPQTQFGLFNADGTPKLAATAIHNLTTILSDNGTGGHTPTTPLGYSITGLPSTGSSMVLGKSNGAYDLVVWAEPKIWNDTTDKEVTAPTESVTVNLGGVHQTVSVYDPLSGTTAIATYTNVSQIVIPVSDHPVIIEIDAPANGSGTAAAPLVNVSGIAADIVGQLSALNADTSLQTINLTDTHILPVASQSTMSYIISHYGNALAAIQGGYSFSVTTSTSQWSQTLTYNANGTLLSTSNSGLSNGLPTSTTIVYADGSTDTTAYTAGVKASEIHVNTDGSKDVFTFNIKGQSYTTEHDSYNASGFLTNVVQTRSDGSTFLKMAQTTGGTKTVDWYDASGNLTTEVVQQTNGSYSTTVYTAGVKTAAYILNADHTQDNWSYNVVGQTYTTQHQHLDAIGKVVAVTRTHADGSLDYTQVIGRDGTDTINNYDAVGNETMSTIFHPGGSKDVYLLNIKGQTYGSEHDTYSATGLLTSQLRTHNDGTTAFQLTQTSDGTRTADTYDATGHLVSETVQMANGYYSTTLYTNGVKTAAYILNADHTQDNWSYNVVGQSYTTMVQHVDATGKVTSVTRTHADGSLDHTQVIGSDGTDTINNYDALGNETLSTIFHPDGSKDVYVLNIKGQTYGTEHDTYNATGLLTSQLRTHNDGTNAFHLVQTSDGTKTADTYDVSGHLTSEVVQMANGYYSTTLYTNGVKTAAYILNADHTQDNWSYNVTGQSYTTMDQHLDATGKVVDVTRTHADGSLDYTQVIGSDGTDTINNYDAVGNETLSTIFHPDGSKDVYLLNIKGQTYGAEHDTYDATGLETSLLRTHNDGTDAFHLTQTSDGTKTADTYDASGTLTSEVVQEANGFNSTTVYTNGVKTAAYILNADHTQDNWSYNVTGQSYTTMDQHLDTTGKVVDVTRTHADGSLDYTQVIGSDGTVTTNNYNATGTETLSTIVNPNGSTDIFKFQVAGLPGATEHDSYAANGHLLQVDVLNGNGLTHNITAVSPSLTIAFDHGAEQVNGFLAGTAANHDVIEIAKSLVADYSHLQITQSGSDALVHVSATDAILLKNIAVGSLDHGNFLFA